MSVAAAPARQREAFSPAVILSLVIVAIVAFAALAVVAAYAPEMRGRSDRGAHALSASAVGFRGATRLLPRVGVIVAEGRDRPEADIGPALRVLTPTLDTSTDKLKRFRPALRTLIILPKWLTIPDPVRSGRVRRRGHANLQPYATELLKLYATETTITTRAGQPTRPRLRVAGGGSAVFREQTFLPLGSISEFQTLSGADWVPELVDERGGIVLAHSRRAPTVFVLSDPDLLNNHGLAQLDNARAGVAVVRALQGEDVVVFDLTLHGMQRGQSIGRVLLEPPWLGATLCAVMTALVLGVQALARFGPARRTGRAFAPGRTLLVDSSAGLVRMARREHELAPAYAALVRDLIRRDTGERATGDDETWLERLAERQGAATPAALEAEAVRARGRDDLLGVARRLYEWRREMTRGRG